MLSYFANLVLHTSCRKKLSYSSLNEAKSVAAIFIYSFKENQLHRFQYDKQQENTTMLTKMFKSRKKLLFVTMVNASISLFNEYKRREQRSSGISDNFDFFVEGKVLVMLD